MQPHQFILYKKNIGNYNYPRKQGTQPEKILGGRIFNFTYTVMAGNTATKPNKLSVND